MDFFLIGAGIPLAFLVGSMLYTLATGLPGGNQGGEY